MTRPIIDCAYIEQRRTEPPAAALERYRRSIESLLPLVELRPVVLEYRTTTTDEAHGYGFYPQAFYRDGTLLKVSPDALYLKGLTVGWDGTVHAATTDLIEGTTRVFVRQSACCCPDRSLDCELLTVKAYLRKTNRQLTQQEYYPSAAWPLIEAAIDRLTLPQKTANTFC